MVPYSSAILPCFLIVILKELIIYWRILDTDILTWIFGKVCIYNKSKRQEYRITELSIIKLFYVVCWLIQNISNLIIKFFVKCYHFFKSINDPKLVHYLMPPWKPVWNKKIKEQKENLINANIIKGIKASSAVKTLQQIFQKHREYACVLNIEKFRL